MDNEIKEFLSKRPDTIAAYGYGSGVFKQSGYKDTDNISYTYSITGTADVNPDEADTITLEAIWEPNTYTITYNSNTPSGATVSGTTSDQTEQAYDSTTTLRANGYTVDGYNFVGWAYSSSATAKDFDAEQANISVSTLAGNNASGSVVGTNGGTITLYAVWESSGSIDDGNLGSMQSFVCNSLTPGHTGTVTDSRDNQSYKIYRIPIDQTYRDSSTIWFTVIAVIVTLMSIMTTLAPMFRDMYKDAKKDKNREALRDFIREEVNIAVNRALNIK